VKLLFGDVCTGPERFVKHNALRRAHASPEEPTECRYVAIIKHRVIVEVREHFK
jgi:hypothetical protein